MSHGQTDVAEALVRVNAAIRSIEGHGAVVPGELREQAEIFARCIAAERELATIKPKYRVDWDCSLQAVRESRGLTVEQLARLVRISPDELLRIESGVDPALTRAVMLATWAGMGLWDLWRPTSAAIEREKLAARSA